MMRRATTMLGLVVAAGAVGVAVSVMAQGHAGHGSPPPSSSTPRTITMEELHRHGGVPRGWKFTLPTGGDAARGRQLFADLECFKCHASQTTGMPKSGAQGSAGPDLSGMGGHHPAEYFAESIIAPNHVVVAGPGFTGPDGRSTMPSYADALSVTQLLDLVAFIKSGDGTAPAHHGDGAAQERVVGPYRVRLEFKPSASKHDGQPHGAAHGGHAHHGEHRSGAPAATGGHLMAFIADATSGDAIPYLPVSAAIQVQGAPTRTVKLVPMLGRDGFHYGADASLPLRTSKVVLSIRSPALHVMGPERSRFARTHTVAFDWSTPAK